jgi:hypothetical protein
LAQVNLAVVINAQGLPICIELVPDNTPDRKVTLAIIKRLRRRFAISTHVPEHNRYGFAETRSNPLEVRTCGDRIKRRQ